MVLSTSAVQRSLMTAMGRGGGQTGIMERSKGKHMIKNAGRSETLQIC